MDNHLTSNVWGVGRGGGVMTIPDGMDTYDWHPENWLPSTTWTPRWHRGILLAVATYGPDSLDFGPQHLNNDKLSFPLNS